MGLENLLFLLLLFLSGFFFLLFNELFIELISAVQEEISEHVSRVLWHLFAELDEAFSQMWNNIVHQVLSDWLRSSIKEVSLLLTNLLELFLFTLLLDLAVPLSFFISDALALSLLLSQLVFLFLSCDDLVNLVDLFLFFESFALGS